ncbi:Transferase protein [Dioscorea alata]|uniref:Transferase protein n=1 Tax=Dioscorea alata TaxID=55571 RepID=A0ACB7UVE9_DIOAL|nr:Transferase protein [Dioscorea alata]
MASFSFTVLEQSAVSPPTGADLGEPLPLTFFDIMWMTSGAVRRLFFYRFPHPTVHFIDSVLPALKSSLSTTLHRFYPLAGKFRCSDEDEGKLEFRYKEGDSVPFTVVEYDGDFDDVSGDHGRAVSKIRPLVSELREDLYEDMPLLAVQVTVFPNKGFVIGVKISHIACDGRSFIHFVRSWAAVCRAESSAESLPSFDRTMFKFPEKLGTATPGDVKHFFESNKQPKKSTTSNDDAMFVLKGFKLSKGDIEKLKQRVLLSAKTVRCSSFMVTCSWAWVSLVKARAYNAERKVQLLFQADARQRLNPPVSVDYFGNCIRPCFAEAVVSDLIGENGLAFACEAIGNGIKELEVGVFNGCDEWGNRFLKTEQPMAVTSSPLFRVYDADFGWGRPVKVDVASLGDSPGVMSLTESRDEEGGIEFAMSLEENEMAAFDSFLLLALDG